MRKFLLSLVLAVAAPAAVAAPVVLQSATATFTQIPFLVSQTIDGNVGGVNGWAIEGIAGGPIAAFETQIDIGGLGGAALTFTLTQNFGAMHTMGSFRLSVTEDDRNSFADGLNNGGDVTANWIVLGPSTALATGGATLTIQQDGSILASGASPETSVYTITASIDVTSITGIRLETFRDASLPDNGPGRTGSGNFVLQEFAVDAVDISDLPNADFDENNLVDGADLARWRTNFGTGATHLQGNADAYLDADVDGRDFLVWQRQLGSVPVTPAAGAVPEPGASALIAAAALGGLLRRRRS